MIGKKNPKPGIRRPTCFDVVVVLYYSQICLEIKIESLHFLGLSLLFLNIKGFNYP